MPNAVIFDERIANGISALNARSEVLGPGRLSRCQRAAIRVEFKGSSSGQATIRSSHRQDFTGTPETIAVLNSPIGGGSQIVAIPVQYLAGFVDIILTQEVDGHGFSAWAQGSR
jgi:hypothetical protein